MSRNLKVENLKKLSAIKTTNGYKIDIANYVYNPSFEHEYPQLKKIINETETDRYYKTVSYFKHYNGTGEYITETYSAKKSDNAWSITKDNKKEVIENNDRFNLKKLIELTEKIA